MNKTLLSLAVVGACLAGFPRPALTQYFGRNAVQYESFDFKVLRTEHFDVYFYEREADAAAQAARMAERWYARLATLLRHELRGRQPLILYADHPDFEQTNVLGQAPGEGTGGVTESFKRRIIMPMGASLAETDHVLGHELVHAFQYDIGGIGRGGGGPLTGGLGRLPLWFIEGMAEYLSVGAVDPNTTMWMRDAVRRDELPDLDDLSNPEYFPYRWGQSFWAYVGGTFGDRVIADALRAGSKSGNVRLALTQVTGQPADSVVAAWHRALRGQAEPVRAVTTVIPDNARRLVATDEDNVYNIAPALSPDGTRMVYLADDGLFSIDLYLADAETGRTIRKLVSSTRDPHLESMQFINSAGAWDPEGRRFVFGAVVTGKPALRIVDTDGDVVREVRVSTVGEIFNPTWSPDGRRIAFSAQAGGVTDLFLYDLERNALERLTDDPYADLEPVWSPSGNALAFVTDRFGTSLQGLTYGEYRLAVMSVSAEGRPGQIRPLPAFSAGKHINPQWSADGRSLFFLANPQGVTNLYRVSLDGGGVTQVTNLYTGISGITALSPGLSVAARAPRAVFSLYTDGGYALYAIDGEEALAGGPLADLPGTTALLPPATRGTGETSVAAQLADVTRGLPAEAAVETPTAVRNYSPRLSLDFVAQPYLAVGADRFGTFVGGGVTLFWSDMLGDHNLVTMAQLNGSFRDFAGLLAYSNRRSRLNWSLAAQQIPYVTGAFGRFVDNSSGQPVLVERVELFRQTHRQLSGVVAYPFNRSRRVELSAGLQHISFSHEVDSIGIYQNGQIAFEGSARRELRDPLSLGVGSAALVHDNSYHGATSPLLGDRWRLEASPVVGSLQFVTALADYRRYLMPVRPFTLAGRVLHVGRYGKDSDDPLIFPLFMGYASLVRGYDVGSFDVSECVATAESDCPVFDQLIGSRMLVGNVELRFPPFGLLGLGGGYYGFLPVEAAVFYDAGVAWTQAQGAQLFGTGPRRIVTSAGVSLRMNLFGYAIGQMDFVRPFDRPAREWMIRFSLTPGF